MWTRKAAFTFTGGIALILIGMMIANNQMMILGLALIAFIVVNSWISGHGDVEVQRTLSADNLYKGDDLYVELLITNRSNRKTQLLEVYDNIPHEMKLRSGLNQMRLNLSPGESARIRYTALPLKRALLDWPSFPPFTEYIQSRSGGDVC